jgi:exonuclease SbcD
MKAELFMEQPPATLRVLHTADWHIGRTLHGKRRYDEFTQFFAWLADTIEEQAIDVLLVAGDIFDVSSPSSRAQELYYNFLTTVAHSSCRHVVIIAGNHDSPTFLDAPKRILKTLAVTVLGCKPASAEDAVVILKNTQNIPELIVCAVPYLRDSDVRKVNADERIEDKDRNLVAGVRDYYAAVATVAAHHQAALGQHIPIIGTGHLYTAGGQTVDGDGVRELYIGSLARITADIFPAEFNYVALGHLHVAQVVNKSPHIRYSGSPIPMGFGEATHTKSLCIVDFAGTSPIIRTHDIPMFQQLARIKGDLAHITAQLHALIATKTTVWAEVTYDSPTVVSNLSDTIEQIVKGSQVEILVIKNTQPNTHGIKRTSITETLDTLTTDEVFTRYLVAHHIPDAQHPMLIQAYQEIVGSINEHDTHAE